MEIRSSLQFDRVKVAPTADPADPLTFEENLSHRYLWNPAAVDQLMADEQVTDPDVAGDIVWPLGDHQGTIRDLAVYDAASDTTTVVNHRTFDAYGNLQSQTNPTVDCLFAYTGRPLDQATGLQNNLHRWYDPTVGRWMSEDPIGFEGKDGNPYAYVGNGPVNAADPSGLDTTLVLHRYAQLIRWSQYFLFDRDRQAYTVYTGGQDITLTLQTGGFVFEQLLRSLSEEQLSNLVYYASSWPILQQTGNWDIVQLNHAGKTDATSISRDFEPLLNSTSYLDGTVTVRGGVYWAAEVNYYLYGILHRVAHDKLPSPWNTQYRPSASEYFYNDVKPYICAYRLLMTVGNPDRINDTFPERRSAGTGILGRVKWAEAGFFNDKSRATSVQLDGDREGEFRTATPSTQLYTGPLEFYVGATGEDIAPYVGDKLPENVLFLAIRLVSPGEDPNKEYSYAYHPTLFSWQLDDPKYEVLRCEVPGLTKTESVELAKSILREMGLLFERNITRY